MNYIQILNALREFTSRERIEFLPLALDTKPISDYAPIQKYVLDLKNVGKPETVAEDLFGALCKDVLGFQPARQVGSGEGWIDFTLTRFLATKKLTRFPAKGIDLNCDRTCQQPRPDANISERCIFNKPKWTVAQPAARNIIFIACLPT